MGKVPASPRPCAGAASSGARCTGRACRRCRRWPWPGRAACSPARRGRPAGRRRCRRWGVRPGGRWQAPTAPDESTMRGSIGRGMRSRSSSASSQRRWRGSTSAVTAALRGVGDVERVGPAAAPPERIQATQLSTVPKQSSPGSARARSGSTSSRMAITLVADALGASRMPSACSTRHVPTVRRSCQPMPGATRRARWPAPTRWSRPAGWRCRRRPPGRRRPARPGPPPGRRRPCGRVELDQAGCGRVGQDRGVVRVLDGRVGAHDGGADARGADVDDEDAAPARPLMTRAPVRTGEAGRTCPG